VLCPFPRAPIPPLGRPVLVTRSGREALERILVYLKPRPRDEIWITTTLNARGLHVSPCVTATVARYCRFGFAPAPRTVAALVIHDYGMPHPHLAAIRDQCRRHGWPLIEDAAHAFASTDATGQRLGTLGDFALFSLPKYFALSRGGLAVGLTGSAAGSEDTAVAAQFDAVLPMVGDIAAARRHNWLLLDSLLGKLGHHSDLPLTPGSVPMVYALHAPRQFALLSRLRRAGIESGPAVHCNRLLLPCHQCLKSEDVHRIARVIGSADAGERSASWPPLYLTPGPRSHAWRAGLTNLR